MNRIGRGTQKIVNLCRESGMRAPAWRDDTTGVTLSLFAQAEGKGFAGALNSRQEALLSMLKQGETIRPADYRHHFADNVSDRQARRDLTELENAGLLERVGAGATTLYSRSKREWKGSNRT